MKSILHHLFPHHTPPPLPTLPNLNHQLHRFTTHAPPPPVTVRTRVAASHLVVVAVNSPSATTADLSVLIPTSVAFLFLYWIANFVVPEIVMKDLQSGDATTDQKPNEEGSTPLSSESKKTGFQ